MQVNTKAAFVLGTQITANHINNNFFINRLPTEGIRATRRTIIDCIEYDEHLEIVSDNVGGDYEICISLTRLRLKEKRVYTVLSDMLFPLKYVIRCAFFRGLNYL